MERSGGRQKEGSKAGRRGKKEGEEEKGDEAALAAGVSSLHAGFNATSSLCCSTNQQSPGSTEAVLRKPS